MRASLALLVVPALLVACREEEPPETDVERGAQLQAVPLWSSSPDLLLSGVFSIAVDSRGNVYAWDMDAGIVVLAPDGQTVRTFSRKGRGPGEYQVAGELQILPEDSVFAFDSGLRRVTVFAPDTSAVAYTVTLERSTESPGFMWLRRVQRPPGYLSVTMPIGTPVEIDRTARRERIWIFRLHSPDGKVLRDSLLILRGEEEITLWRDAGGRAVSMSVQIPFGPQNLFEVSPDDLIVHGRTDSLNIQLHDLEGRHVGGFSVPHEPVPFTADDIERRISGFRQSPANRGFGDQYADAVREAAPETWPAFHKLVVDDRGRIWIWIHTDDAVPPLWTVFDRSGEAIGSVRLAFNLEAVRDGVAYGYANDEFGVPTIVASRIEGLDAGD